MNGSECTPCTVSQQIFASPSATTNMSCDLVVRASQPLQVQKRKQPYDGPGYGTFGKTKLARLPLIPEVLYDIDHCISRFEASALRSFAAFRAVALELRIVDLFDTDRKGGRATKRLETPAEYATLLFEATVRRIADPERSFEARLGALYLLLTLHELQQSSPKVPVPILATQWNGFERLSRELRSLRHADGFRALHTLWAGERLSHLFGGESTLMTIRDQLNDREVERDAAVLPASGGASAEPGGGLFATQLIDALPTLTADEASYSAALAQARSALAATDAPAASSSLLRSRLPSTAGDLAAQIRQELDDHRAGVVVPTGVDDDDAVIPASASAHNAAVPNLVPTLDEEGLVVDASYLRREHVRRRAYKPRAKRTRDGTHSGTHSGNSLAAGLVVVGRATEDGRPRRS